MTSIPGFGVFLTNVMMVTRSSLACHVWVKAGSEMQHPSAETTDDLLEDKDEIDEDGEEDDSIDEVSVSRELTLKQYLCCIEHSLFGLSVSYGIGEIQY